MAKRTFSKSVANAAQQQVVNFVKADSRLTKSTFNRSVWTDGQKLRITGYDFVVCEEDLAKAMADNPTATPQELAKTLRSFSVFTVSLVTPDGEKPYNDLWLKTTLASVTDTYGDDHTPNGAFNNIVRTAEASSQNDEETMRNAITALNGRLVVVSRKKAYKADYFNTTKTRKLLELEIEG